MTMFRDPIVEEVRRIREANAARFNYDLDRIVEDARRRQEESGRKIIRAPRPPRTAKKRKRA
jgi:hypothetical protein